VETFLVEIDALLAAMSPAERELQIARLVQLFKAAGVMRETFKVKGSYRMAAWLLEQGAAKNTGDQVLAKMTKKATERALSHVLRIITAAS
jgi:hypothetical protein